MSTTDAGSVSIDVDGAIAWVRFGNPARRNAMSASAWRSLRQFAERTSTGTDIRVVVLRGRDDRLFTAGADISEFATQRASEHLAREYDDLVESACQAIEAMPQTTIAFAGGACVGAGNSIATSCDFRVASEKTYLRLPAVSLGLGYDARGIARLLRVYGPAVARNLVLTGEKVSAERAYALGAVDYLHDSASAEAEVRSLAGRLASNAPLTVRAAKASFKAFEVVAAGPLLEEAVRLGLVADTSQDYAEGRSAFLNRRAPVFQGR